MSNYSTPLRISYTFSTATTNTTWAIAKPKGMTACRVADLQVSVTTTYNAVTTEAKLAVGVASNTDVAGYITFGTTAAGSATGWASEWIRETNPLRPLLDLTASSNPSAVSTAAEALEALGPVLVTFTANTGGSPAGAGVATVVLEWF